MAIAEAQAGVFATVQAADAGIRRDLLSDRVRAGRLFRLHRGVYAIVPPRLLGVRGLRMAAVLAGGQGAGLSHRSAGIHTGFLAGTGSRIVEITVPRRGGHHRGGLCIHRSSTLRPDDVVVTYGIPTTSVARTLLDLAGVLSVDQLESAMDECGRLELLDLDALAEQIVHNHGRPESARLQSIVDRWQYIWSLTESELEKLTLQGLDAAGLPRPELQVTLNLGDGGPRIRADFLYRDARLILEADSWRWHAHRLEQDSARDQRAAAAGFQTLRITRRQVATDMPRIAATVASVHAQRTRAAA